MSWIRLMTAPMVRIDTRLSRTPPVMAPGARAKGYRPTKPDHWTFHRRSISLLCHVQRSWQVRRATGHARSDGPKDAAGDGAPARIRAGAPHRTGQPGRAPAERGHRLHVAAAAAAAGLDLLARRRVREQPQGEVLRHHPARREAAGPGNRGLAANGRRDRPFPVPRWGIGRAYCSSVAGPVSRDPPPR